MILKCLFNPYSSTNLTELAKAARLLAALNPDGPTGDELLRAARALAAATAALLNSAQPENMKVCSVFILIIDQGKNYF